MAFQCTKRTKLITFNFKLLHRRISTKSFLKKNGLADSRNALSVKERERDRNWHISIGVVQNSNVLDQFESMATVLPREPFRV